MDLDGRHVPGKTGGFQAQSSRWDVGGADTRLSRPGNANERCSNGRTGLRSKASGCVSLSREGYGCWRRGGRLIWESNGFGESFEHQHLRNRGCARETEVKQRPEVTATALPRADAYACICRCVYVLERVGKRGQRIYLGVQAGMMRSTSIGGVDLLSPMTLQYPSCAETPRG